MQRPKYALMSNTALAVVAVLLFLGCGGGGGGTATPTPQKSPTPDGTTIQAIIDPSQNLMITSGPDAFEPGASVHVFDANLNHVATTANAVGALNISNDEFPTGFIKTAGTSVTITQVATGQTESDAINVTIQDITQI